jgi:hypothetical protein
MVEIYLTNPNRVVRIFSSYTPLVIAIQQMLEYDNNNRISDTKVC